MKLNASILESRQTAYRIVVFAYGKQHSCSQMESMKSNQQLE